MGLGFADVVYYIVGLQKHSATVVQPHATVVHPGPAGRQNTDFME